MLAETDQVVINGQFSILLYLFSNAGVVDPHLAMRNFFVEISFQGPLMRPTILAFLSLAFGYPLALAMQHGFDATAWPSDALSPGTWFGDFAQHFDPGQIAEVYWDIATARSPAFANNGWSYPILLAFFPLGIAVLLRFAPKRPKPKREDGGTFGSARFATDAERTAMSRGLELGIDPQTGRAVRVAVQGTLATIAPPRTGKTSGLLIPNLSYPEAGAWSGPAVVLDSKGEVYRATRERRERLGRRTVCIDPLGSVSA